MRFNAPVSKSICRFKFGQKFDTIIFVRNNRTISENLIKEMTAFGRHFNPLSSRAIPIADAGTVFRLITTPSQHQRLIIFHLLHLECKRFFCICQF